MALYNFCFVASRKDHLEVVKMLIGKGANIENKDNDGRTSLMLGIKLKFYVFISNKYDFKLKHQLMVTLVWLTFN